MLHIAPRAYAPIPADDFVLTVDVDTSACTSAGSSIPAPIQHRLNDFEKNGVKLTLPDLYLAGATLAKRPSSPVASQAHLQYVASVLQEWKIRTEDLRGTKYLVCEPPRDNDHYKTTGTEILGVGVGILLAEKLYNLPRRFWTQTTGNARFDYIGTQPGKKIGLSTYLEVRGRLDRNKWRDAVVEAQAKLSTVNPRHINTACAILVAPRSQPLLRAARKKDVLIMDPTYQGAEDNAEFGVLRTLLRHYAPFFIEQGGYPEKWGERLLEIAGWQDKDFSAYLQRGDKLLSFDIRSVAKPWRKRWSYDNYEFCGTDFSGVALPFGWDSYTPRQQRGAFFFGIWREIIEALRDGRLQEIAEMEVVPVVSKYQDNLFVLQSDAVAMAWAPTQEQLNSNAFATALATLPTHTTQQVKIVEDIGNDAKESIIREHRP